MNYLQRPIQWIRSPLRFYHVKPFRSIIWIISIFEGKGSRKDNSRHEEIFDSDHLKIWENLRDFRRNTFQLLSLTTLFRSTSNSMDTFPPEILPFYVTLFHRTSNETSSLYDVSEAAINIARLMIITGSNDSTVDDTRALWFTFPWSLCTLDAIMFKRCQPILLRNAGGGNVYLSFERKERKIDFSTRSVFRCRFRSDGFCISLPPLQFHRQKCNFDENLFTYRVHWFPF